MNNLDVDVFLNVGIIILEIIALIICLNTFGSVDLVYYTIDSNIFLLISSILYLVYRNKLPRIVQLFKYSSTLSVLITFLVVVFVLLPMYNFNFNFLLWDGPNLYVHVLCPIIALISFVFFEKNDLENTFKNNLCAVYFTVIYGIILIALNIEKIVVGPYPFLKVYEQSIFISLFWVILIIGAALLLARLLLMIRDLDRILY